MGFFDLSRKERRTYVAKALGYNPAEPRSWPVQTIDRVIDEAERAAEQKLTEVLYHLGRSR